MITTVGPAGMRRDRRRATLVWLWLAVGAGLTGSATGSATAATLHVANSGVDAAGCGLAGQPCRSITRALVHANGGDAIEVGPGRYGDLDHDGALGGPGEEAPPAACGCMVHISKRVSLKSRDGALVTVIDARWPFPSMPGGYRGATVVRIDAGGVVLGDPGNGFTVIGDQVGVQVSTGTNEVYLGGNLAVANGGVGFAVGGDSHVLDSNVALANAGGGFFVASHGTLLFHNLASVNRGSGFFLQGSGFVVRGNQATANGDVGFAVLPPPPPTEVPPGTPPVVAARLLDNVARGNRSAGIRLWAPITMERTTLYGNGDAPHFVPANCGLVNESGAAVDASHTYWGAATGPGADPADKAGPGSGCDIGAGAVTTVVPFAAHAFSHPNDGIK